MPRLCDVDLLRQPVGPGGQFIVTAAPGGEGIAAQAVYEHHIEYALGRKRRGGWEQVGHGPQP
jgi:hypothetical protein